MKPERIAELRTLSEIFDFIQVPTSELADLLTAAGREAKLREALEIITAPDMWLENSSGLLEWRGVEDFMAIAAAALEAKGGLRD